ncbi:DUF6384 family protein [Chthonobacter albigriseus]|uniref:DUF6384 family protein n=1 Tax=Chthonobacter albigriseus TaxID=1683161 RepID=UPI0015EE3C77|nr:DUF6384 family protein [Chthonobacter albigriseus]
MADVSAAGPGASGGAPAGRLDELMLAMDVVDTLRHQEGLVAKELSQDARDSELKERLRKLYESQGLEVSDRILEEGIRALKESRFAYEPPRQSFALTLAKAWVNRGKVARVVLALAVLGAGVWGWQSWRTSSEQAATEAARVEITETLPKSLEAAAAAVLAEARDARAQRVAADRIADARAALARGDVAATRTAVAAIDALRAELTRTYVLRIVSRPGESSAVWRIPDVNSSARNHYLLVEAVTPGGEVLQLPVTSEEDGKTTAVAMWGVRVSEATFNRVRRDKEADGIVNDNIVGEKPRGSLDVAYAMPVLGGAITAW